jgi:hypothetical protein
MKLRSILIPTFLGLASYPKQWLCLELVEKVDQVQTLGIQFKHK